MKAILRRVGVLEDRLAPRENAASQRSAALLRERRRRRLEASGQPFEDWSPPDPPTALCRFLSYAETLRLCRQRRLERNRRLQETNIDPQRISSS
jgi:hypothetical protein